MSGQRPPRCRLVDLRATCFAALRAWARAAWGAELAANEPEGAYASWTGDGIDVYLQMASTTRGGQVRLVVKARVLKDAGEL